VIVAFDVPVDIGRDAAQRAAEAELARPEYAADQPAPPVRVLLWLLREFGTLIDEAAQRSSGGYLGLIALAVVLVLGLTAMRLVLGRLSRVRASKGALFEDRPTSAADHRRVADAHAEAGEWALAVRERLRAVVREMEERDLLDSRAGRTATEVAAEAGRALPGCAEALRDATGSFAEVWYGGRPATEEMDVALRGLDDAVRRARPEVLAGSAP
jgi:Domain of unknown function (DUF4129)